MADDGPNRIGACFVVLQDFECAGANRFNEFGDSSSERCLGSFEY